MKQGIPRVRTCEILKQQSTAIVPSVIKCGNEVAFA